MQEYIMLAGYTDISVLMSIICVLSIENMTTFVSDGLYNPLLDGINKLLAVVDDLSISVPSIHESINELVLGSAVLPKPHLVT